MGHKVAWKNGLVHYFNVWKNDVMIGKGYVVSRQGDMGQPMLVNFEGEALPEDWYTLQMTEYKPCIIPKNVQ